MIEQCWQWSKRRIPDFNIPHLAAIEVKQVAIEALEQLMSGDDYLKFVYKQLDRLKGRAKEVVEHRGRNNFNGYS